MDVMTSKAPIKVAFFATRLRRTGPMRQMLGMVRASVAEGFDVRIVTLFEEFCDDSIKEQYRDLLPDEAFDCLGVSKAMSVFSGGRVAKRAFSDFRPDVIYCLGMPLYAIAVKYNAAAHVTTLRNYCYEDYPDRYGKAMSVYLCARDMRLLSKAENNAAEYVFSCSSSISEMYKERKGLSFPFIRNGVDCNKFAPASVEEKAEARVRLGIPRDAKLFVYAAIFNERKNQEYILRAVTDAADYDDCLFAFLGDGPKFRELKEKYASDSRFLFVGQVDNVTEYLDAADFYVTSSTSEGLPNGVMEALAAGLPVVMSDIPQHKEIASLGTAAELFSLNDCDGCAQAIGRVLGRDYAVTGAEARRMAVEDLGSANMGSRYVAVFKDAAKAYRGQNE